VSSDLRASNTSLYRALKRERVDAGAQRRRPGEGSTSDQACKTLTPHRFAMGPPLPFQSTGEGKEDPLTPALSPVPGARGEGRWGRGGRFPAAPPVFTGNLQGNLPAASKSVVYTQKAFSSNGFSVTLAERGVARHSHFFPRSLRADPSSLYRALKRERVAAGAQRRRPGEGSRGDHACQTLTPHRYAMGPPLPLRSAGEGPVSAVVPP